MQTSKMASRDGLYGSNLFPQRSLCPSPTPQSSCIWKWGCRRRLRGHGVAEGSAALQREETLDLCPVGRVQATRGPQVFPMRHGRPRLGPSRETEATSSLEGAAASPLT